MNWDTVKGNWKQFRGKVKEEWGDLTNDHLDEIDGQREQLAGKVQETYGLSKDATEKQIKDFENRYKRSGPARLNNNPRFISGLFSVSVKARGCSWRRTFLVGYVRR